MVYNYINCTDEELENIEKVREPSRNMTCIICSRNEREVVLASDTWVSYAGDEALFADHIGHKLFFNKENKIVVGHSGPRDLEYTLYSKDVIKEAIVNLSDYIQLVCDMYNGRNIERCLTILEAIAKLIIDENMKVKNPKLMSIEYIICFFDAEKKQNVIYLMEYGAQIENRQLTSGITEGIFKGYTHCIGVLKDWYNLAFGNDDLKKFPLNLIKNKAINDVQRQIDFDIMDYSRKMIGGPVEWVTMDAEGNIDTNIQKS